MTNPIPKAVLDQHTVVLGKTRSGKSSTLRLLIERLLDDGKPVCIIDPKGDWWGLKSSADGKRAGYEVVIFGGKHADVPINAHSGKVVGELVATGNRPCIIDLGGWMVGERTRFFIDFASTLFTRTHGHRWLCIDEAHNFAPQGKIMDPDAGKMLHWANRLASEGAGKGIVLMSASQRPQKVHKDYLTSHETLIAKRVIHPLDRSAMKDWIDGCGDPAKGKEVLDSLAGLQRSQGWVWSPEIDFGPKLVEFPMFKTYDSFAVQTGAADRKLKGWASVNLDEVKTKLAAVVEEAKANDPKELRAEIVKLRAEKAKLETATPAAVAPDKDALQAAEQKGFDQAKKKLTAAAEREVRKRVKDAFLILRKHASDAFDGMNADLKDLGLAEANLSVEFEPEAPPPRATMVTPAPKAPRAVPTVAPRTPSRANSATPTADGAYTGPQMKILRALAMWRSLRHDTPTRQMVAAIAGYPPSSGGFKNPISALNTMGAVAYPTAGLVSLRADGIETPSVDEARRILISNLDGPKRKIVAALLDRGVRSREDVAADAGYPVSSGGFKNPMSALRTLGIVDYPTSGQVCLSDWAQELLTGYEMRIAA